MIRLGKVERMSDKEARISVWFVEFLDDLPTISLREEVIERSSIFARGIKNGDMVAVHWQNICQKLTPRQVRWLEHYTSEAIKYVKIKGE